MQRTPGAVAADCPETCNKPPYSEYTCLWLDTEMQMTLHASGGMSHSIPWHILHSPPPSMRNSGCVHVCNLNVMSMWEYPSTFAECIGMLHMQGRPRILYGWKQHTRTTFLMV